MKKSHYLKLIPCSILIVAMLSSTAYVIQEKRWESPSVAMNLSSSTLKAGHSTQSSNAMADWNAATPYFRFSTGGSTVNAITVGTVSNSSALAVTTTATQGNFGTSNWKKIIRAPIVINSAKEIGTANNTESGLFHLRSIMRHEYGHVMGLGHAENTLMRTAMARNTEYAITANDVEGIKYLYNDINGALGVKRSAEFTDEVGQIAQLWGVSDVENLVVGCVLFEAFDRLSAAEVAQNIVVGKVVSIEPGFSETIAEGVSLYYSKVNIEVQEVLKGDASGIITIQMLGGSDGDAIHVYEDVLQYNVGEELIVYTNSGANSMQTPYTANSMQYVLGEQYKVPLDGAPAAYGMFQTNARQEIIDQIKSDIAATSAQ